MLGTARALAVTRREALVRLRETGVCTSANVLHVRVVELLLLVWHWVVLTHLHLLLAVRHLAVLLLIPRELVWVDHRQHL